MHANPAFVFGKVGNPIHDSLEQAWPDIAGDHIDDAAMASGCSTKPASAWPKINMKIFSKNSICYLGLQIYG